MTFFCKIDALAYMPVLTFVYILMGMNSTCQSTCCTEFAGFEHHVFHSCHTANISKLTLVWIALVWVIFPPDSET